MISRFHPSSASQSVRPAGNKKSPVRRFRTGDAAGKAPANDHYCWLPRLRELKPPGKCVSRAEAALRGPAPIRIPLFRRPSYRMERLAPFPLPFRSSRHLPEPYRHCAALSKKNTGKTAWRKCDLQGNNRLFTVCMRWIECFYRTYRRCHNETIKYRYTHGDNACSVMASTAAATRVAPLPSGGAPGGSLLC